MKSRQKPKYSYFLALAVNREANKLKKHQPQPNRVDLDAPVPPDWWDGDADWAEWVPREQQETNMVLEIAQWPNSAVTGETDILQFQWRAEGSANWNPAQPPINIDGPLDPDDFPMPLELMASNFAQEGIFELRYQVTIDAGTTTDSLVTRFIIDKTPPNGNQSPAALVFDDPDVIAEGITQEYLDANGGVVIDIPPYTDIQPCDSAEIYIHNPGVTPTGPVHTGEINDDLELTIPAAAFDGLRDGTIFLYYRLLDKVGNRGPTSDSTSTGLFTELLPDPPLDAPVVLGLGDDGLLTLEEVLANARTIKVEVPLHTNWLEGDEIVLTWGTATTTVSHIVVGGETPMTLNVPYGTILKPAFGNATDPLDTAVSYVVRRGNRSFPSSATTIRVDFFVPGPENPNRPDPVNPALPRVTVRGTGDTPVDNVLRVEDRNLPIKVSVNRYAPIGAGEEMRLYWDSFEHQIGIFTPVAAGTDPYEFDVLWDSIKDLPSGTAVPVFYTVGRIDGTGNVEANTPTLVNASAALPIRLASPEFPDAGQAADGSPILNCTSFIGPTQYVVVNVPGNNPHLVGGEELTFTWQCYTDRLGTVPAGASQEHIHILTVAEATNGYTFNTGAFDDWILPVGRNGSVRLTYESDGNIPMEGGVLIRAAAMDAGGICPPNNRGNARGGCGCR